MHRKGGLIGNFEFSNGKLLEAEIFEGNHTQEGSKDRPQLYILRSPLSTCLIL